METLFMMSREGAKSLRATLSEGAPVRDTYFDRLYPVRVQTVSSLFWTPVHVAHQAAIWLAAGGAKKILDVGAGVGKFCIVGAIHSPATFVGVEIQKSLVTAAQYAMEAMDVPNAEMVHGSFESLEWSDFDAFYLYNPFELDTAGWLEQRLDNAGGLDRFSEHVSAVVQLFDAASPGTRVALYHGFGGTMPPDYRQVVGPTPIDNLQFWVKGG